MTTSSPAFAFAESSAEDTNSLMSVESSVGGDSSVGGGTFIGGGGGLVGGLPDNSEVDASGPSLTEPSGAILKITGDGRLFAALYLPGLPNYPELETLYIERAFVDNPSSWSHFYTFVWYPDWNMFSATEDTSRGIRPFGSVPCVDYLDYATSYQSFYLKARAVCTVEGVSTEITYEPVLFTVPDNAKPGEDTTDKPADDAGGSGGNQGGIGQGEAERPTIKPPNIEIGGSQDSASSNSDSTTNSEATGGDLLQVPSPLPKAYAATPSETESQDGFASTADDAQTNPAVALNETATMQSESSEKASLEANASAASEEKTDQEKANRIPGFVLVTVATLTLGGMCALVLKLRRR